MGIGIGPHTGGLPVSNYLSFADQASAASANSSVFGPIGGVSIPECLGKLFNFFRFTFLFTFPRFSIV